MNIWLPIVTNVIAVLVVLAGLLVGKRTKWYLELSKIFSLAGLGVACHYLIPTVTPLLNKIPFVSNLTELSVLSTNSLNSVTFALLFLASYIIVAITFGIINCIIEHKSKHRVKVSRSVKVKAAGSHKKHHEKRPANVAGCLLGCILGLMLSFTLFIPVKYALTDVSKAIDKPELTTGYEYTAYGQLDKLTNIDNIIIGE